MKDATRLTRIGRAAHETGLVNPAIERASTILAPSAGELYDAPPGRPHYGRVGLASQQALRAAIQDLQGGHFCALTSSGLQANILSVLTVVEAGGTVLAADNIYGPVRSFLQNIAPRYGIKTRFVEPDIASEIGDHIDGGVQAILLESPGSLTMELQDLEAIARIAQDKGVTTIIDDTWSAGLTLKPLEIGIDLAAQALTKYVAGHSDVMLGAVVARTEALGQRLQATERGMGFYAAPDDAYLAVRGLRTLELRMQRSAASSLAIADWLSARAEVGAIRHPARSDHPQHHLFKRDFTGGAGLFSFEVPGWSVSDSEVFLDAMEIFGIGYSWGGFESLAIHCDPQIRRSATATKHDGALIRLAIGMEAPEDLILDLEKGFAAVATRG